MLLDQEMERLVEETMNEWHAPGLSISILQQGESIYEKGHGYSNIDEKSKVNLDTVFVGASTTKAFTATALGILADEQVFDWETPIIEYVPELRLFDHLVSQEINGLDLLSHRTGYPRHDKVWLGSAKSRMELIRSLRHLESNCGFRTTWQYNNLMYVLAGYLVEVISGKTWEKFLKERILEPLGMKRTNFSVRDIPTMGNYAQGYAWKNRAFHPVAFREVDAIGPAGSINTTARDMSQWIQMQMNPDQKIVSKESLATIHQPRMIAPSFLPGSYPEILHTQYALGWFSEVYRGQRIIYHVGNLDGFYALVSFMPAHKIGQVFLSNTTPNRAPYVLSYSFYDAILKLSPLDWNRKIREKVDDLERNEEEMNARKKKERIQNTEPSFAMTEFAGTYFHPGYGEIKVEIHGGSMVMNYNDFKANLQHFHYDVFSCEGQEKIFPGLTLVTFWGDGKGSVRKMSLPMEPAVGAREIAFLKNSE